MKRKSGYSEEDELGGEDPYSASKGCSREYFLSYKNSFFQNRSKLG